MIRKVTANDIPSLVDLTRTTRLATYNSLLSPSQQTAFHAANAPDLVEAMICQKVKQPGYCAYVYEQTGRIEGYIIANPHTGTIPFLFVRQGQHGKGVGSALVNHLKATTSTRAYRVVVLEGNVRARTFYESRGFLVVGVKDQLYFGVRRMVMEWKRSTVPSTEIPRTTQPV